MPLERGLKERTPHRRPHVESINNRSCRAQIGGQTDGRFEFVECL